MATEKEKLLVEWTKTAESQFYETLDFWIIKTRSTTYSEKLAKLTWRKIEYIRIHPLGAKSTKNNNIRIAIMGHYSLIYKLTSQKIILVSFWDNRQNPMKLLEILKSLSK